MQSLACNSVLCTRHSTDSKPALNEIVDTTAAPANGRGCKTPTYACGCGREDPHHQPGCKTCDLLSTTWNEMYIFATEHDTAWATWQHTQDNSLHLPTHTNTRRGTTAYTACLSVRGTFYAAGMLPLTAPYMRRQKLLPAVPHKGHGHTSNAWVLVVVNSQSYDRATTCPSASVMQQATDARLQSYLAAGILHSAGSLAIQ